VISKRIAIRLLAVALILSVGLFAMQGAAHWHGHSADEQHCQVCHISHVAALQPTVRMQMQAPVEVARFALTEDQDSSLDPIFTHKIPRAPPV
jgi:hypothetical protein